MPNRRKGRNLGYSKPHSALVTNQRLTRRNAQTQNNKKKMMRVTSLRLEAK